MFSQLLPQIALLHNFKKYLSKSVSAFFLSSVLKIMHDFKEAFSQQEFTLIVTKF